MKNLGGVDKENSDLKEKNKELRSDLGIITKDFMNLIEGI